MINETYLKDDKKIEKLGKQAFLMEMWVFT